MPSKLLKMNRSRLPKRAATQTEKDLGVLAGKTRLLKLQMLANVAQPQNSKPVAANSNGSQTFYQVQDNMHNKALQEGWQKVDKGGNGDCGCRVIACGINNTDIASEDVAHAAGILRAETIQHSEAR